MKQLLVFFALILGLGVAKTKTNNTQIEQLATSKDETQARAKGPTKEETISFLKSQINSYEKTYTTGGTKFIKNHKYVNKITFDNCLITVVEHLNYNDEYLSGYKSDYIRERTFTFDIKDIEKIDAVEFPPEKESSTTLYGLNFTSKNGEKLINEKTIMKGTSSNGKIDTNNSELQSDTYLFVSFEGRERIKQAFNHLRKLCGAPEPISFD